MTTDEAIATIKDIRDTFRIRSGGEVALDLAIAALATDRRAWEAVTDPVHLSKSEDGWIAVFVNEERGFWHGRGPTPQQAVLAAKEQA